MPFDRGDKGEELFAVSPIRSRLCWLVGLILFAAVSVTPLVADARADEAAGDIPPDLRVLGLGTGSSEAEDVDAIEQPISWRPLVFRHYFDTPSGFRAEDDQDARLHLAVGEGKLFVSSEVRDTVYVYDSTTSDLTPLGQIQVDQPLGVAFYRGELFVLEAGKDAVVVFTPSGERKREFKLTSGIPALDALLSSGQRLSGLDVAWNEVWISINRELTLVLDARTGAIKGVHGRPRGPLTDPLSAGTPESPEFPACLDGLSEFGQMCPRDRPHVDLHPLVVYTPVPGAPSADPEVQRRYLEHRLFNDWRDVSTVPEVDGVLAGPNLLQRQLVPDLAQTGSEIAGDFFMNRGGLPVSLGPGWENSPYGLGLGNRSFGDGTDAVWGMHWVLAVEAGSVGDIGWSDPASRWRAIQEYSLDEILTGARTLAPPKRSWVPADYGDTGYRDVVYQNRRTRIDWEGRLTQSDWLTGTHSLDYIVSDADVFLTGRRGELRYELARNLSSVVLKVDGNVVATSTEPMGTLSFNTASVSNGPHTLTLTANLTTGESVTNTNPRLLTDNSPPQGELVAPETYVWGLRRIYSTMADQHSGPASWTLELLAPGQSSWQYVCSDTSPDPQTGLYSCDWNTTWFPDGEYSLRGRMVDRALEGGNIGYSHIWSAIEVNNTEPKEVSALVGEPSLAGSSYALPQTFSEPAVADTPPDEAETAPSYEGGDAACPPDDPLIYEIEPTYGAGSGLPTPELALQVFLTLKPVPHIPVALLQELERTSDLVVFGGGALGSPQVLVEVVRTADNRWLTQAMAGCSTYLDRFAIPALDLPGTGVHELDATASILTR